MPTEELPIVEADFIFLGLSLVIFKYIPNSDNKVIMIKTFIFQFQQLTKIDVMIEFKIVG
jgi:hypothetical protein